MKQFRRIVNCIFASVFILMLFTAINVEENSTYNRTDFKVDLSEGWTVLEGDGMRTRMTFPYRFEDESNKVRFARTLPDVPDYSVLLVKCNYKSMTAYIDGEEIYHSMPSTYGMMETDLGHYISIIPLETEYSGKEIIITVEERESGYNSDIKHVKMTSIAQYTAQKIEEDVINLIVSIILLILAAASLIAWVIVYKRNGTLPEERYHSLLWITLFSTSVGVWFFTDSHILAIYTGHFALSGIFNYLAFSLIPVSLLGIVKSTCSKKLTALLWIVSGAKIILVAEWALFLTGIVDLSSMLILLQAAIVIAAGIAGVFLVWKRDLFPTGSVIRYAIWAVFGVAIIAVFAYISGRDWMPLALMTVIVIIFSVFLNTILGVIRTVREMALNTQYKKYAMTDIMTGLKSRYTFSIFEAQQKLGLPPEDMHLIFLDIDVLKHANDTLGHIAGDEIIIATSNCIREAFGDIADCFRMGGDEFLVATVSKADVVSKRIDKFNRLITDWKGRYIDAFTVSYGVAAAKDYPDMNFEDLLRKADDMMYQNKKQKTEVR